MVIETRYRILELHGCSMRIMCTIVQHDDALVQQSRQTGGSHELVWSRVSLHFCIRARDMRIFGQRHMELGIGIWPMGQMLYRTMCCGVVMCCQYIGRNIVENSFENG
jgi:hypothetical protein